VRSFRYFLLLAFIAVPALAQVLPPALDSGQAPVLLSIEEAVQRALARNFDLEIERESFGISSGRLASAFSAYIPTVTASLEYADRQSPGYDYTGPSRIDSSGSSGEIALTGSLPTGATYSASLNASDRAYTRSGTFDYDASDGSLSLVEITQPLLRDFRIDRTRLTLRQRRADVRISRLGILQQAIDTIGDVERAYYALSAAYATVEVRAEALALARQTLADIRARVQIGTVSPLDEQQSAAEAAANEADLLSARQSLRERQNTLKRLIGDDYAAWRETAITPSTPLATGHPVTDYTASAARALSRRPDLIQLQLALDQKSDATLYYEDQLRPRLDLTGGYGYQAADSGLRGTLSQLRDRDYPYYTVGVTLSFPWSRSAQRGDLRAARGEERQAVLRIDQKLDDAVSAVASTRLRVTATAAARAYAEAALEAARRRYAAGSLTAFEVLQSQRDLVSARADAITALADHQQAFSDLRRREAASIDTWNLIAALPSP
jgi:outer membrane protein